MNSIFARTSALWMKYDKYEYRTDENEAEYITPCPNATISPYKPLDMAKQLVLDALEIRLHTTKDKNK